MIDLRSDTVTRPTPAMRDAMHAAEVGDDIFDGDPTVIQLEETVAARLGKEAALFTPSSTQSNLLALLTHCQRGDEMIVGQEAHTYLYEAGGGACLGGIQPQPIPQEEDGTLDLARVEELIKPDDFHFAKTRLLCLENTTWGKVLPTNYSTAARQLVNRHGLGLHLDGARLFNASIASGIPIDRLADSYDSVSICLSKGLGAPVGSVLVSSQSFIAEARRWRKMLGGGMRQSGILAAAGLHALEHHVERLHKDHRRAAQLGEALSGISGIVVEPVQTNMVFVRFQSPAQSDLAERLKEKGILIGGYVFGALRLVTHIDIDDKGLEKAITAFGEVLGRY
ncbi:MAG: low-specificity L-threonine aldolase [Verrucomicrobiota bacterium]